MSDSGHEIDSPLYWVPQAHILMALGLLTACLLTVYISWNHVSPCLFPSLESSLSLDVARPYPLSTEDFTHFITHIIQIFADFG